MAILLPECLTDINRLTDLLSVSSSFDTNYTDALIAVINEISYDLLNKSHTGSFKYQSVTEYHDGLGLDKLVTNYFPILSITSIHDDRDRSYSSATLVTSTDYDILIDRYNARIPNTGIIRKYDGLWGNGQKNIQVIYTSGFKSFQVLEGINDQIVVNEGGSDITVTLTSGTYDAVSLATQLTADFLASAVANVWTVTYDTTSHHYKIAVDSASSIAWTASGTRHKEFGKMIGFVIDADDSSSTTHYSDYPALGIPEDLINGVNNIVRWHFHEIVEKLVGKTSASQDLGGSTSFNFDSVPRYMRDILRPYMEIRM